jgi:Ni/Co efflux regulator RcnB
MGRLLAAALTLGLLVPFHAFAESGTEHPSHGTKPTKPHHKAGGGSPHGSGGGSHHEPSGSHHGPSGGAQHTGPQHEPSQHHRPSHGHAHRAPSHGWSNPPHYGRPPRAGEYYYQGGWHGRVHGPAYVYPNGWHYRRWPIGSHLPVVFLAPPYFYADYGAVGLVAPGPGLAWVRFGPDLLLVNLQTGIVVDVVYGALY